MKHAFLIIAHNAPEVLATLLHQLDDADFDVFLHIDARAVEMYQRFSKYHPRRGGFFLMENPVEVCWGDISMMDIEVILFRNAMLHGSYAYYHLLSGVDLVLKSPQKMKTFFEEHNGHEFVGFWNTSEHQRDLYRKVNRYYLFTRHLKDKGTWKHHVTAPCRNLALVFQKAIGYKRLNGGLEFRKGSQWASITDGFCRYLVKHAPLLRARFKYTLCPDEIFLQTILWNSPFKKNIYAPDTGNIEKSTLRKIDWQRGSPYVWQDADLQELLKSEALFARKFSQENMKLVDAVLKNTSAGV